MSAGTATAPTRHTSPVLVVAGVVMTLAGLGFAVFCFFLASLVTYGLYSWQDPQLDPSVVLPLVGIAVGVPLGPLVLSVGGHRRRWLWVAALSSVTAVVLASLATWVPVALGLR